MANCLIYPFSLDSQLLHLTSDIYKMSRDICKIFPKAHLFPNVQACFIQNICEKSQTCLNLYIWFSTVFAAYSEQGLGGCMNACFWELSAFCIGLNDLQKIWLQVHRCTNKQIPGKFQKNWRQDLKQRTFAGEQSLFKTLRLYLWNSHVKR